MKKRYLVFSLCILILCLCGCGASSQKRLNVADYVEFEVTGYNGYGKLEATIDYDSIEYDYADLSFKKATSSEMRLIQSEYDPNELLTECIDGYFDLGSLENGHLSNGDNIIFHFDIDTETINEYFKINIISNDITYTVNDLKELPTFDPFEGVEISAIGLDGYGYANVLINNPILNEDFYSVDKNQNLSNGDVINISISEKSVDTIIKTYEMVPSTLEKSFTVEGLMTYEDTVTTEVKDIVIKEYTDMRTSEMIKPREYLLSLFGISFLTIDERTDDTKALFGDYNIDKLPSVYADQLYLAPKMWYDIGKFYNIDMVDGEYNAELYATYILVDKSSKYITWQFVFKDDYTDNITTTTAYRFITCESMNLNDDGTVYIDRGRLKKNNPIYLDEKTMYDELVTKYKNTCDVYEVK